MSAMPRWIMAMRSTPMPKAKPVIFSGLQAGGLPCAVRCSSTAAKTAGPHAAAEECEEDVTTLLNFPLLVFVVSFFLLWRAAWVGKRINHRRQVLSDEDIRSDFGVVQAATLTLLGLIIGFSFS